MPPASADMGQTRATTHAGGLRLELPGRASASPSGTVSSPG